MRILFYVSKQYSIPIISPLMDCLDAAGGHEYAVLASANVARVLHQQGIRQAGTVVTTMLEGKRFAPDFCLSPGNYVDWRIPGIKVGLFHGIGVEKASHYRIRHFFDVYLTSGPLVTGRFCELAKRYRYFLVRETGWPKMDYIMNYPANGLRERLGIAQGKNVILYAPTFSARLESCTELLGMLGQCIRADEVWYVKFHEFMNRGLVARLREMAGDSLRLVDTFDITPYLHCADVLVSDTSSVVYEFMALDKPVVTYRTTGARDKGIDIISSRELRPALDRALSCPGEHAQAHRRHLAQVNPNLQGTICSDVLATLESILTNNELPARRKPLNLYRKLTIMKNEVFRKGYLK